jgi:hypothetical protein
VKSTSCNVIHSHRHSRRLSFVHTKVFGARVIAILHECCRLTGVGYASLRPGNALYRGDESMRMSTSCPKPVYYKLCSTPCNIHGLIPITIELQVTSLAWSLFSPQLDHVPRIGGRDDHGAFPLFLVWVISPPNTS